MHIYDPNAGHNQRRLRKPRLYTSDMHSYLMLRRC